MRISPYETTDRLITLGQAPPISPEKALEIFWQRLEAFDQEVLINQQSRSAVIRELIIVCGIDAYKYVGPEAWRRLTVARIVGETVSAVYDPLTSSLWFDSWMDDRPFVPRRSYAVATNADRLRSKDSELIGDLERLLT